MREHREATGLDPRSATVCGAVALLFVAHTVYLACVTEDAFITFRYAENLIAGHGFVWNPGETPVEGYTNFGWLILCAGILGLGLDLPLASQVIGVAAGLATLLVVYRAGRLLGWSPLFASAPCLMLAVSGPFATWASSGMETVWFTLWVATAVLAHSQFLKNGRSHDAWVTCAALILATLTRPEGVLIAGLVTAASIFAVLRTESLARPKPLAAVTLTYAAVVLVYVLWRWNYFQYPLPNTFYAKTGGGLAQAMRGAQYSGLFALHFVSPWLLAMLLPLALPRDAARKATRHLLLPLSATIVVVYSVYICAVGGDYMAMYRFFVPILPLLYLLVAAALHRASESNQSTKNLALMVAIALGVLGSGFHSTPLESDWVEEPERMHGNYRGVETERWYVARHQLIGKFFARYGKEGESLATGAIGAVAFYSGLDVYDVHGITDAHIAHKGTAVGVLGTGLPGHEKSDYPYIFAKRPTFYMFSRKLRSEPLGGIPLLVAEVDELVAREYRVGSIFLEDKVNGESGYFSFLERRDRKPGRR
ncbi:MAG: arabinofuranosyltransferase [Myxococcota bacterium]|jgi:arabinofuranosyltransferase